jgi:hypothetical protein
MLPSNFEKRDPFGAGESVYDGKNCRIRVA